MEATLMERTFKESAAGANELDVHIQHGNIVIHAVEGDEWQFDWSGNGGEMPEIEREGGVLHIRQQRHPVNPPRLDLRLELPARVEVVRLETGNGKIEADSLRGVAQLTSGNGELLVRSAGGTTTLTTRSGRIQVLEGDGRLEAHSGSGEIIVRAVAGEARLHTRSGKVEVTAPDDLLLDVESGHGDIRLSGGSIRELRARTGGGRVECSCDLGAGQHTLASGNGDVLLSAALGGVELATGSGRIEVGEARGPLKARSGNGDLVLRAASGEVDLHTSSGKIEVGSAQDLRIKAYSGHGDIHIDAGSVQNLMLETRSGTIRCRAELAEGAHKVVDGNGDIMLQETAGEVVLTTSSGRIEVVDAGGRLQARTGNGDLMVQGASGEVELHSGSGRIEIGAPEGLAISAHSGKGDIRIGAGTVRRLAVATNHGRVECLAQPGPGHHELSSRNGDVLLQLPANVRAHVDLQTSSGQVHSDFPLVRVGRPGSMGFNGKRMVGGIGAGEPDLDVVLRTNHGQVILRRGDEAIMATDGDIANAPAEAPPIPPVPPSTVVAPPVPPVPPYEAQIVSTPQATPDRALAVLEALAHGDISVEEADALLRDTNA
jgi:DUF4097 and DUF4098 domain-containing protein YvlB